MWMNGSIAQKYSRLQQKLTEIPPVICFIVVQFWSAFVNYAKRDYFCGLFYNFILQKLQHANIIKVCIILLLHRAFREIILIIAPTNALT